jgi:hypothetical protein
MNNLYRKTIYVVGFLAVFVLGSLSVVQASPLKKLKGKIITSNYEISLPTKADEFVPKVLEQDREVVKQDESGRWVINMVAFFKHPLHKEGVGLVVLDANGDPISLAEVSTTKGQTTLACQMVVESTNTPDQPHILQVYYAKNNKPVVLAKKPIVLK